MRNNLSSLVKLSHGPFPDDDPRAVSGDIHPTNHDASRVQSSALGSMVLGSAPPPGTHGWSNFFGNVNLGGG